MLKLTDKQITKIFLIILVVVSGFPQFNPQYFVHSSGSIKVIGVTMGLLIAVLIYYKWKYAKHLFYLILVPSIFFDFFAITKVSDKYFYGFFILMLSHIGLVVFFMESKSIINYLAETKLELKSVDQIEQYPNG